MEIVVDVLTFVLRLQINMSVCLSVCLSVWGPSPPPPPPTPFKPPPMVTATLIILDIRTKTSSNNYLNLVQFNENKSRPSTTDSHMVQTSILKGKISSGTKKYAAFCFSLSRQQTVVNHFVMNAPRVVVVCKRLG